MGMMIHRASLRRRAAEQKAVAPVTPVVEEKGNKETAVEPKVEAYKKNNRRGRRKS